jgi:hypothetical protein
MRANGAAGYQATHRKHRRYIPGMRLTGGSDDELLTEAWAYLTAEEAFHLYMSLSYYFGDDEVGPGWHTHVGSEDGPELTIAIEN